MNDLLLTMAEVAIALAGFSGVVVAFGPSMSVVPNFRLSLLLTLSGEVVFFSLFPFLLTLKLSDTSVWMVGALVYGSVHLAHIAYSVFGYQEERTGFSTPNVDKVLMSIGLLISASLIGAALFGSTSDIQLVYASLLVFVLGVAATQFFRLLMLVQQSKMDRDDV